MRFAGIVVGCVVLDIVLHLVTSGFSSTPPTPDYSPLAERLGTGGAATLWALFAFSGVACVFYRFRNRIPGPALTRGPRYGAGIASLWLVAMLEGVPLFGNAVVDEFVVGLSDAIPVLVMGALLGRLVAKNSDRTESDCVPLVRKLLALCIFAVVFIAGRYAAYTTEAIRSGLQTHALETFLWTVLMGICIGVNGLLLGQAARATSSSRSAATFGLCLFGVNWAFFLLFMPMVFSGFLNDVLARIAIDVVLVTAGHYLTYSTVLRR